MAAHEDLLKEVQSSIERALPAIQVDVFRRFVDESEKLRKDYDELKKDYLTLTQTSERDARELQSL